MKPEIVSLGLLMVMLFGLWGFLYKYGINKTNLLSALLATSIFYLSADIVIIAYLLYQGIDIPGGISLGALGIGTIFSVLASVVLLYSLERYPGSIVIPMVSLYPAVSAALAILVLQERLETNTALGIFFAVVAGFFLTR